ncbi:chromate resistance protein ChrB domain-containing protein [Chroococcus sp. FPU101]|uniref:chromate resistance protein ChrB domain-containing protein n=1 Tax=Chroococcus sp. FPU101 TaxID=1974212 RepID=UPI001A8CAEDD|nr:chromate resistance protein ChrB domain-containing protein [Chroococcus sp. FPU101]GFE71997.1 chrB protein [Chroococcus sp. FPU101]
MNWLVFSYSLPSKAQSSPRVTLWRRLRRIGAITIKTGVYILPAKDECIEAFQWLAQEVQHAKGEALVIHVEQFEGLSDEQLIQLFRDARYNEYEEIEQKATEIENTLNSATDELIKEQIREKLAKLQKRYTEILTLDFFDCPAANSVAIHLRRIEQLLQPSLIKPSKPVLLSDYQDRQWVTRPRPFIDRLACAWLIRRWINPQAIIRYSLHPQPSEVTFDMKEAEFGHQGNLCSFETMLLRFGLEDSALHTIAKLVHELDLRDGLYLVPETVGVETIVKGWLLANLSDTELETRGYQLFEGLYLAFSQFNHKM